MPTEPSLSAISAIVERIAGYITSHISARFAAAGQKVGIALSGGPDSVALLLLGQQLGWEMTALHCNFHLRGEESLRDQAFVERLCNQLDIPLQVTSFDTADYAAENGISIEMAARELRYGWFSQMAQSLGLDAIATGHHRDDNIETLLLNMIRGCGLKGVTAIPPQRGIFIRPLLPVSRKEILQWLEATGTPFVTDSTNLSNDFNRNRWRNIVLPIMEDSFPGCREQLAATIDNLADERSLLESLIAEKRAYFTTPDNRLAIREIASDPNADILLYHILDGELNISQVRQLLSTSGSSGKRFRGKRKTFLLDRGYLLTLPNDNNLLSNPEAFPSSPIESRLISREEFHPRRNPYYAWFDADRLIASGGFQVRTPRTGDRIKPFGMKGSSLLSDIFTGNKLNLADKQNYPVVDSADGIIWLPGLKNSRLFPVTDSTENILQLHYTTKKI